MKRFTVLIMAFLLIISCKKDLPNQVLNPSSPGGSIDLRDSWGFGIYGDMHNEAMEAVESYPVTAGDLSTDTGYFKFVVRFDTTFLGNNYASYAHNSQFVKHVVPLIAKQTTLIDQLENIDGKLDTLQLWGEITYGEKQVLLQLRDACLDLDSESITPTGFYNTLSSLSRSVDTSYHLSREIINIGLASHAYWSIYEFDPEDDEPDPMPIFWNDVGGALLGATISAAWDYADDGNITWGSIGKGALTGAITGSLGLAGKIGKGIKYWWKNK